MGRRIFLIIFIVALMGIGIFSYFKAKEKYQDVVKKEKELKVLEREVRNLEKEKRDLVREYYFLTTLEGIEKVARESLGMVKKGEVPLLIKKIEKGGKIQK